MRTVRTGRRLATICAVLFLAACASQRSGAFIDSPLATGQTSPDSGKWIAVANFDGRSITTYPAFGHGDVAPLTLIHGPITHLTDPSGMDLTGSIIATVNPSRDEVDIFRRHDIGNAKPEKIFGPATLLDQPVAIRVGGNAFWVTNDGGSYSITAYAIGAHGNWAPSVIITGPDTGLHSPSGVTQDEIIGDIFVSNRNGSSSSVTEYAPDANGDAVPIATIAGPDTGLEIPGGISLDQTGNIYVTSEGEPSLGPNSIREYAAGSNGDVAPIRVISGPLTKLVDPRGIKVGTSGRIFVTNTDQNDIVVFGAGASGNVGPVQDIHGVNTQMHHPLGISEN